jgi:dTDP-4-dehydrorhamnose 3,5-epimerase
MHRRGSPLAPRCRLSRVTLIKPRRFSDDRGWFMETWSRRALASLGIDVDFVQDNHSLSRPVGTVRGLHFQTPPHGQGKLVRCTAGRIMDYAVDIRRGSPTWGRSVGAELSAENGHQLWVPVGFAHAFVTLEPDTEVVYKVTSYYAPAHDGGIRWDSAGIDWPLPPSGPVLSDKDKALPALDAFETPFAFEGEPLPAHLD